MLKRLLRNRLTQDALVLYGVQITAYILPLLTLPYLTRVLGPANFGLVALGSALAQYFLVITEYGFAVTGTRSTAIAREQLPEVSRIYSTILACKLSLLVLCFLVLAGVVFVTPKLRMYWPLYLLSYLLVVGWCLSPNWLFQGLQRMKFVAISDYGAKVISVALIFLVVHHSSDYVLAAAVQYGGFVVSALIGLGITFFGLHVRLVRVTWQDMKKALLEGWPVFVSMASITVMNSSNTFILGMASSPEQVGYYSAAARLVMAIRALANPINNAVFPHIANLAAKSRKEALEFFRRRVLLLNAPFLLMTVGMFVTAPLAVRIIYGPRYAETGVLLRIVALVPLLHSLEMCFGNYYMLAFGYEKEWSRIVRRMMVLNFLLIFPLMKLLGPARGIAATMILAESFALGSYMLFYRKTSSAAAQEPVAVSSK